MGLEPSPRASCEGVVLIPSPIVINSCKRYSSKKGLRGKNLEGNQIWVSGAGRREWCGGPKARDGSHPAEEPGRGRPEGSSRNRNTCPTRKSDSDQCWLKEQHGAPVGRNGPSWWLSIREFTCIAEDAGLTPGLERSPRERNGNPLQHFCLGNLMNRGTGQAAVHGVTKSWTQLSN